MKPEVIDELVEEVLGRLRPELLLGLGQSCRTVSVEKRSDRVRYIVECGAQRVGLSVGGPRVQSDLARYLDHTLLRPNATEEEIRKLCEEGLEYQFASVCVNPCWVPLASRLLENSTVKVCTVAGFPLGANRTDVKEYEARRSVFDGATEIDMVINVGALKSNNDPAVHDDIGAVVRACHENGAHCKVIIETAFLTEDEKVKACTLAREAGADFVKTSTGFGPAGATAADVALMRQVVGPELGVKAAGGIRGLAETREMIEAGATRIGASAGVKIVKTKA